MPEDAANTQTFCMLLIEEGAVYNPDGEIVPTAGIKDQTTDWEALVLFMLNWILWERTALTFDGETPNVCPSRGFANQRLAIDSRIAKRNEEIKLIRISIGPSQLPQS